MADLHSNRKEYERKLAKAIEKSLRLVGGQAERFAKETISDMKAVDTGFLRNSITWALDGEHANIKDYTDDAQSQKGKYDGIAPKQETRTVYIGTNIYYAPYVEFGTTKVDPRPFLSQSIESHQDDFKKLFEEAIRHFL